MKKMNLIYKICLSGILIALSTIISRFLSIPLYVVGLPFIKISLATSVIMFASFYLGPVFGAIVGFGEDLLGSIVVQQGGSYNPIYSISVILGGLMPYFLYLLFKKINIDKKFPFSFVVTLGVGSIFIILYTLIEGKVKYNGTYYIFEPWLKILLCVLPVILSVLAVFIIKFIYKKYQNLKVFKVYNPYILATSIFLTYILFKVPVQSLVMFIMMNGINFEGFMIIFGARMITSFITAFFDLVIVILGLNISLRYSYKGALVEYNNKYE